MALPDELDLTGRMTPDLAGEDLLDAIDAASDQDRTTWLASDGKRIAKIAPVDEISDDILLVALRQRGLSGIKARLAAKRRETGPVWDASQVSHEMTPVARDLLLQSMARQVEEIHRAVGLERDDEGDLVPASFPDPLGPPWYGKLDEITARVAAAGELVMVTRDWLIQVLSGSLPPEIVNSIWQELARTSSPATTREVWEALHAGSSDRSEPAGSTASGWAEDRQGRIYPDRPLTIQIVRDALSLAGVAASRETINAWSGDQMARAYDWAIRMHLSASGNQVASPPRPAFIFGKSS